MLVLLLLFAAGCAHKPQPDNIDDICDIFDQYPQWYDYAKRSEERWQTPIEIQMAFVHQESSFVADARPPRPRVLGFIPWFRSSSAFGYAQAQNPVWGEYREDAARRDAHRTQMIDALDFIGWYNHRTHQRLGIAKDDARRLYLAYHEGHGGYQRGSYQQKPFLQRVSRNVERRAREYAEQLEGCEDDFRCWRWYQFWPFCR
ncbi:hypothetical protein HH1059_15350 [Halorhodospira halochloris]|uniref:Transglycosylase SLT domain-containing protein n=1 Tax=Halorhodospira halochloris TaxID=1052 RepID=A0A120MZY8_HALHR|nr:hypothetical protein HH1059_15350 [Halorhodospira halochloris]